MERHLEVCMNSWAVIVLILLSSFSSGGFAQDYELSLQRQNELNQEFMGFANSKEPLRWLNDKVRKLYMLHAKADQELILFDQVLERLDTEIEFFQSENYFKLMTLKRMSDRHMAEIRHLVETYMEWGGRSDSEWMREYLVYVANLPLGDQFELAVEWPSIRSFYKRLEQEHFDGDAIMMDWRQYLQQVDLIDRYRAFGDLIRDSVGLQYAQDVLEQDIDFLREYEEVKGIYSNVFQPKTAALNAKNKVCYSPSWGRKGNIIGHRFPSGKWALTFDDGPYRGRSDKIISALRNTNNEATFFWMASKVGRHPSFVRIAYQSGSEVGSHSYTHPNLRKLGPKGRYRQIVSATEKIQKTIASYGLSDQIKYYRLPYGAGVNNKNIRSMIAKQKMVHVFWNVDSLDWQDKSAKSIVKRVTKQMKLRRKGVILFHDVHKQSVEASQMLMTKLSGQRHQSLHKLSDLVEVKGRCD